VPSSSHALICTVVCIKYQILFKNNLHYFNSFSKTLSGMFERVCQLSIKGKKWLMYLLYRNSKKTCWFKLFLENKCYIICLDWIQTGNISHNDCRNTKNILSICQTLQIFSWKKWKMNFEQDRTFPMCGRPKREETATRPSVLSTSSHTDFSLVWPKQGRLEVLWAKRQSSTTKKSYHE
jgi:hypothetical protein